METLNPRRSGGVPKTVWRATELPVPQAAVGCAVGPAGRCREALPQVSVQAKAQEASLAPTSSGRTGLPRRIHLFRIGGIQSGRHLRKTRGLEPVPNPNLAPVWSGLVRLVQGSKASRQGSISISARSLVPDLAQTLHPPAIDRPFVQDWKHPVRTPSEEN